MMFIAPHQTSLTISPVRDVVLFGKGVSVAPLLQASFNRVTRPDGAEQVIFAFFSEGRLVDNALLTPIEDDYKFAAPSEDYSLDRLTTFETGDRSNSWRIGSMHKGYSIMWPQDMRVSTSNPGARWPFELIKDDHQFKLFVQGPYKGDDRPRTDGLIGPGEELIEANTTADISWMKLKVEHNGVTYHIFRAVAALGDDGAVIVSGHCPSAASDGKKDILIAVANSIQPML